MNTSTYNPVGRPSTNTNNHEYTAQSEFSLLQRRSAENFQMTFDKVEKETEMSQLTITGNPIIESAPLVAPNKNVVLQNPVMEVKKITTGN